MTAEVINFNTPKEPVCAFCKVTMTKATNMVVSATGKAICDKCIIKCKSLLKEEDK